MSPGKTTTKKRPAAGNRKTSPAGKGGPARRPAAAKRSKSGPARRSPSAKARDEGGKLLIVESPTKARTLNRILGRGFTVLSSQGHVVDLPQKSLAVDVDDGFALENVVIPAKKKILAGLVQAAQGKETVFLATDPDREGEAIAHFVQEALAVPEERVFRVLFHEITREGIEKALASPGKVNRRLVDAQQARRAIDRLAGYKLSRLLWDKVWRGLSGGRVQSVALRLVADREREIWAHRAEDYWVLTASLGTDAPPSFHARLGTREGKKLRILSQPEADAIAAELRSLPFRVAEVKTRRARRAPAPPFITSTLQQEAARKLGFTAKRTMAVAQQLYEGIPMGEMGTAGLITYMRTDSVRVSEEALAASRAQIRSRFGERHLPPQPRYYRNRKGAQDAHEAVRPSRCEITPDRAAPFLDRDQSRLYDLIYKRFLASQMADAEMDRTRVAVAAGPYGLTASGEVLLFPGFLSLYQEGRDEPARPRVNNEGEEDEGNGGETLPPLADGQELALLDLLSEKKTTQPPPRFNDASLVRELEEKGIGRPSTYAAILDTLQRRSYVEKKERRFHPTELGLAVSDLLVEGFPENIMDAGFTARMEEELDEVEEGNRSYRDTLADFWEPFSRTLAAADERLAAVKGGIATSLACPTCGKALLMRFSFRAGVFAGAFLGCSAYPDCPFTSNLARDEHGEVHIAEKPPQELREERCPQCRAQMMTATGRFGRYLRCSTPACKGTRPYPTGVACPLPGCGGNLVEKRSRFGFWYPCDNYPSCTYSVRNTPVARPCPSCGFPLLTRREGKRGVFLTCPKCRERMSGEAPATSSEGDVPGG